MSELPHSHTHSTQSPQMVAVRHKSAQSPATPSNGQLFTVRQQTTPTHALLTRCLPDAAHWCARTFVCPRVFTCRCVRRDERQAGDATHRQQSPAMRPAIHHWFPARPAAHPSVCKEELLVRVVTVPRRIARAPVISPSLALLFPPHPSLSLNTRMYM